MSDEREKEKEKNDEVEESPYHFYHQHPLTLIETQRDYICSGCTRTISPGETAFECREDSCTPKLILHKGCAKMPREIQVWTHPQHTLIQKQPTSYFPSCAVCKREIDWVGYFCASSCPFQIHVGCVLNRRVLQRCIDHPSHPQHQLMMLGRVGRSYSMRCHACGNKERGNSYMCMVCQYWIHESCAQLSTTVLFHHHHHLHPLSLVYNLPVEYIKYNFRCNICFRVLLPRYWVYHCQPCRYVVHIKCAIRTTTTNVDADYAAEDEEVIVFPLKNGVEEMVASFVTKLGGVMANPNDQIDYKFHSHDHQLRLVSSSSLHHQEEEDEEEVEENSDEDDFNSGNQSELVCDACTTPLIFPKKAESAEKYGSNYYMSCGECKYFLHWACFHLPPQLPSHPLHYLGHNLTLQTCPNLSFVKCSICDIYTNGLFYKCKKCHDFILDIKCASLPNIIKHKSHSRGPRYNLKLLIRETTRSLTYSLTRMCSACGRDTYGCTCYQCDACKIILHSSCALLPAFVTNRAWDKHRLPLRFDASANHPSSFCCDICEGDMNPKSWMYHCRTCDLSVHPYCFPTVSGEYQNTKFGQQYDVASIHHHPIAYQLLTKKLHCDVCGRKKYYGCEGFQCASDKCEFFMCFYRCAENRKAEMKAV